MPKIIYRPNPVPPPFEPPTPISVPLTFTAKQAGSMFAFDIEGSVTGVSLSYSTDNGQTWNPYIFGQSVNLAVVGDSVMFKGDNNSFSVDAGNYIYCVMSGIIAASGSMAYLLDSNGVSKALTPNCFIYMFKGCTSLVQAPILPESALAEFCYGYMFQGCTSLVQAPNLPATSLAGYCYAYMFKGCTSLIKSPSLPAISLAEYCYVNMFYGCTSLSQAPSLPATSLVLGCYESMFEECSSLVQSPSLPAISLAENCYSNMFYGCTSLSQAPSLPATSLENYCYNHMFYGCSSLEQAPYLPATALVEQCYAKMFQGCTSLCYIQCNATNISANDCLIDWLENVATNGLFKKNASMNDWTSGTSGIPEGWTIENI